MSINLSECLVSFREAARLVPGRPHNSTLHRWRLRGVRGVRLESTLIGGRRYTSREAIERFVSAVSAAANGEQPGPPKPRERDKAVEQAERELEEEGF